MFHFEVKPLKCTTLNRNEYKQRQMKTNDFKCAVSRTIRAFTWIHRYKSILMNIENERIRYRAHFDHKYTQFNVVYKKCCYCLWRKLKNKQALSNEFAKTFNQTMVFVNANGIDFIWKRNNTINFIANNNKLASKTQLDRLMGASPSLMMRKIWTVIDLLFNFQEDLLCDVIYMIIFMHRFTWNQWRVTSIALILGFFELYGIYSFECTTQSV